MAALILCTQQRDVRDQRSEGTNSRCCVRDDLDGFSRFVLVEVSLGRVVGGGVEGKVILGWFQLARS